MLKRFWAILLAVSLLFASCIGLVACDDGDGEGSGEQTGGTDDGKDDGKDDGLSTDAKVDYTVTVLDTDGTPVMGAEVQLLNKDNNTKYPKEETDIDGKVTFSRKAGNYVAILASVPDDYTVADFDVEYNFSNNSALIRVDLKVYPRYTIKVVDQDGNPVVGAKVQACINTLCVDFPNVTDQNGESHREIEVDSYQGKINALPAGYSERPGTVGQYYSFTGDEATGFFVTIVVVKD